MANRPQPGPQHEGVQAARQIAAFLPQAGGSIQRRWQTTSVTWRMVDNDGYWHIPCISAEGGTRNSLTSGKTS